LLPRMPFSYKLGYLSQKIKSSLFGYTEWEEKADVATNSESWGPNTTQLSELASGTFHPTIRNEILRILLKKLKFRPSHWRQCNKALICLEYIIKNGDVSVVPYIKKYSQLIRYIADHFYFTEGYDDRGRAVRAQANKVLSMLDTSQSIMKERAAAKSLRGKFTGIGASNKVASSHSDFPEADTSELREFSTEQDLQEHNDYLLALKLQREEEMRSGRRVQDEAFQAPSTRSFNQRESRYPAEYASSYTTMDRARNSNTLRTHDAVYEDVFDGFQEAPSPGKFLTEEQSRSPADPGDRSRQNSPRTEGSTSKEFDFSELFSDMSVSATPANPGAPRLADTNGSMNADKKSSALDDFF